MNAYETANQIIENLKDRAGFYDWWHDIDEEIKSEILMEIANSIQEKHTVS